MRAFIAIKLPDKLLEELKRVQEELDRGWRGISWVKPSSIHLTIKFLGEIEEKRAVDIEKALKDASADTTPFTLTAEGVGAFPNLRNPRVVWTGIRQSEVLNRLQKGIDEGLAALGFTKEDRPFSPHLTLCRVKSFADGRELGSVVDEIKPDINVDFEVSSVILFRSSLSPKGAEYSIVKKIEFRRP